MTNADLRPRPLGDRAFLLEWQASDVTTGTIAAFARHIARLSLPWLQELVPAYRTIAVYIRSSDVTVEQASEELLRALRDFAPSADRNDRKLVELPVSYGGDDGPDLEEAAARCGMSAERFAAMHSEPVYEVAMIGFAPGFPYLSGLPEELAQPRHRTPRLNVPAGAVGIAGGQTGVYPVDSPGGWQIIGRTPARLFRPEAEQPFLLAPGDRVKFVPASGGETRMAEEAVNAAAGKPNRRSGRTMPAALIVLKPGMHTTVQDAGRPGWQAYGVSVGGAMDRYALRTANILVGNDEDAAGLEFTLIGGSFIAEQDLLVALCGADFEASADGEAIPMNKPVAVRGGTTIALGRAASGCRAYMAVAGGIDVPTVLGSRSADTRARIGGGSGDGSPLVAGERLACGHPSALSLVIGDSLHRRLRLEGRRWATVTWHTSGNGSEQRADRSATVRLRVLPGAEWDQFDVEANNRLFGSAYRVDASSDRMGIRLGGAPVERRSASELASHGVSPGTVQIPPDGQPIVLAAGCQPTGGYPKAAHVIAADWPLLAQLAPGRRVRFEMVEEKDALLARRERERDISLLKAGVFARVCALTTGGTT
ncbi:5-oxoprolinase subunit PxpB [Cohnella sp. GCM10027633]|uniref:5-oxoprolinase subunit PxpB n=1 Tax=unclassified Cohnella TaxID=2636738 RepID=UPI00363FBF6E